MPIGLVSLLCGLYLLILPGVPPDYESWKLCNDMPGLGLPYPTPDPTTGQWHPFALQRNLQFLSNYLQTAQGIRLTRSSSAQSIPNATSTLISWDTIVYDTTSGPSNLDGVFWDSGTPTDIIIPSTGTYGIAASANFNTSSIGLRSLTILGNSGTTTIAFDRNDAPSGGDTTVVHTVGFYKLSKGTVVTVGVLQTSLGSLNLNASTLNFISIHRLGN